MSKVHWAKVKILDGKPYCGVLGGTYNSPPLTADAHAVTCRRCLRFARKEIRQAKMSEL